MTYLKANRNALELVGVDAERVANALRHETRRGTRRISREDKSSGTTIETPLRRQAAYAARRQFERELQSEADFFARTNQYATPSLARQRCRKAMPIRKMRKHYL